MQYKEVAGGICAPKGFAAAGVHCGIRANHSEKYDLALIKADVRCAAAGVYTTNKVCGAPIKVDRAHLKDGYAQAIIVNSGNANTCAANGVALAEECCALVGKALNMDEKDVLPASTGVIGQPMVIDPFARGIPAAAEKLAATAQGSTDAATAIMTTDTHKKEYAIQFELGGKVCTVGAIGKGSGMIAPNMATMLAFYTTDAAVSPALLEKAKAYLADLQFDNMELEVSALDLHYLYANVEAVKLLDEIRVISRPHGLDRVFPVTKLEIPLDSPENTQFTLGDTVQTSLTSVNNQISAAILEKIEGLPKAHNILKEAKENATQIMTAATTGYITITRDEYGSDTLYISNIRDYTKADKLWKWNMNGLGYSKDYGKTFGLAITMDGSIVADYITTGVLNADVIRAGTLKDYGGNFSLDFESGKLTMKKGSIDIGDGNFTVDEEGNLTARRGTFAGTLAAAKGTFSGTLVGVDGNFKGVVQASDFLDRAGNSMMDDERFKSKYLSVYGLTVTNGVRTTFAVDSSGSVTIDGKVTLSAGSTINWASVTNQNLTSNPAYSLASTANANAATAKSAADDAYDEASAAWSRANKAYQDRCTDQNVFDVLTSGGTKFGIFSDSYSGRLYINADYIRSGTINADYIDLSCDYGGFCKGHGSDGQHTTYGAMMYGSNGPGWEPYIIVTNAGARISGSGADLVVSSGITMSEEPSYGSDLRIKNSIDYDLASYEAFFLALKPSTFKYNKGTSGRKHFGFIAQDVEQAMLDTGLTSDQLAALVKDPVKEILSDGITDYRYSIRYGELIALNTHMIQKLYQMVEELLQQKEG